MCRSAAAKEWGLGRVRCAVSWGLGTGKSCLLSEGVRVPRAFCFWLAYLFSCERGIGCEAVLFRHSQLGLEWRAVHFHSFSAPLTSFKVCTELQFISQGRQHAKLQLCIHFVIPCAGTLIQNNMAVFGSQVPLFHRAPSTSQIET